MFKRMIVAVLTVLAMICLAGNVDAAKSNATPPLEVEELARNSDSIGNGNGRPDKPDVWTFEPVKPSPRIRENSNPTPQQPVKPPKPQPQQPANTSDGDNWLIYLYVCGTDLERKWGGMTADLKEMQAVKLPPNVKVLIQTGNTKTWHHDIVNANGRYIYDSNGLRRVGAPFESNMYEPATLKGFLEYGREQEKTFKPAHRIFIFTDHGGIQGVNYEDMDNFLSLNGITEALSAVYNPSPANPAFDLIAFDACEMGSYECAGSIYGFARYMVASEPSTAGSGLYYTGWLGELAKNPGVSSFELGKKMCDDYCETNKNDPAGYGQQAVYSVIDMSRFENLRTAHENFFKAALNLNDATAFKRTAENRRTKNYERDFVDLVSLIDNQAVPLPRALSREAEALKAAIDGAVVYIKHGKLGVGGGISTYYPYKNPGGWEYFKEHKSASENQKALYRQIMSLPPMTGAQANVQDTSTPRGKGSSNFNVAALQGLPLTLGKDNHVTAKLTPEQLKSVSRVGCLIFMGVDFGNSEVGLEDEGAIVLGNNIAVKRDWQSGTFRDDFNARWLKLDDRLISVELTFQGDGYRLYEAPIKLNGEPCALQISYTEADKKYHVDGAHKYSENGMASRGGFTLKAGDEITPLFMALVPPYATDADEGAIIQRFYDSTGNVVAILKASEGKAFTLENLSVEEKLIDDYTEFAYCFEFFAPDGTAAISQGVIFTVEDGKVTNAELQPFKQIDVTAK